MGWRASSQFGKINGQWTNKEKDLYINTLELLAIFISSKSFQRNFLGEHIRIMSDSATAIAYVNNMGGSRSITYHKIAKQTWEWAKMQGVWISAAHIPGQKNIEADKKSRQFKNTAEWMLSKGTFFFITKQFGQADIDLFATRANKKINKYISWKPDSDPIAIDAFSVTWEK